MLTMLAQPAKCKCTGALFAVVMLLLAAGKGLIISRNQQIVKYKLMQEPVCWSALA